MVKPAFNGLPVEVSLPPKETWEVQLKENDGYEGKVPLDPSLRAWEVEHRDFNPMVT